RPFARFHEPSLAPWDDEVLSHNGSYPSGHTLRGWTAALILMEINPANADTLLARGFMFSESRVIVGAHWQSDVDAGRLAASAAVAKMHTSPEFLEQMEKAKKEFALLTKSEKSKKSKSKK
ncbi:MAG: phosphatase PAP2 family protein, partial [Bacteroidales bacterium]|nr:phosphatase PAP2 family protein [Bacteroidales bacterium]